MSSATHAASGKLTLGGLMSRLLFILALWAGLVFLTMHYVGHVIPTAYQISQARTEAALEEAKALANPEPPAATAAAATSSTTPAKSEASAAPVAASATPAASTASAGTAAPAASAPKGPVKLPKDVLLAGYNRTALTNVAIFYSIVISIFCVGVIILQIFKYKHVEEEEPAH